MQGVSCSVISFFLNISEMHSCGPYGNILDHHVQQYIGFPLLTVMSNSPTLCGEDQVNTMDLTSLRRRSM